MYHTFIYTTQTVSRMSIQDNIILISFMRFLQMNNRYASNVYRSLNSLNLYKISMIINNLYSSMKFSCTLNCFKHF